MRKKKPDSSINAMVKAGGLVTDREWPIYLFGLTRDDGADWLIRKVHGYDLSAITLDMLNAVTHKLSEWWRDELEEKGKMPKKLTLAQFNELWLDSDGSVEVVIKESEIRKFLKKDYPKAFIHKHMKRIGTIALEGKAPVDWKQDHRDPLGKYRWTICEVTGGFADVICVTDPPSERTKQFQKFRLPARKKGRWKGTEEDLYVVRFIGTWGKAFAAHVLNQRVKMMPERFYTYLSPTAKMLFRVISGTDYSPITLTTDQCSKILGWKPETTHGTLRTTLISRALEGLVKYYFINSFKPEPEGKTTTQWVIYKRKNWFYPPELEEGE